MNGEAPNPVVTVPDPGRALTVAQAAAIMGVDSSTMTKYARDFGGIRVGRCVRFFENRGRGFMPTQTKRRGVLRWRGQVWKHGRVAASKWFGSTEKDRRAAILWEEETKKSLE